MQAKPPEPRLSVLILTRNRLDVLRNCVHSILRQQRHDFEIVILDDASDGVDTASAIAQEFADPRIRPYQSPMSLGVAGVRNFLMQKAAGIQH
jgi:O-antigen biosynthesis protein